MVVLLEGEVGALTMPWKEVVAPAKPWIAPVCDEAQNRVYLQLLQLFGWPCSRWVVPGEESSHLQYEQNGRNYETSIRYANSYSGEVCI